MPSRVHECKTDWAGMRRAKAGDRQGQQRRRRKPSGRRELERLARSRRPAAVSVVREHTLTARQDPARAPRARENGCSPKRLTLASARKKAYLPFGKASPSRDAFLSLAVPGVAMTLRGGHARAFVLGSL